MIDTSKLLAGLPTPLREELLKRYQEIAKNYIEHRWEPAELNGGKFAEVAFSIAEGAIAGSFPLTVSKPPNFLAACRALEQKPANSAIAGDRSLRVLIPRQLAALYEIRNNRGVGHIGGDVDANAMDAAVVFSSASWVLAEFVRIFHNVTTQEAQTAVNALSERAVPIVWVVPGTALRRVLDKDLDAAEQTLVLLHTKQGWVPEKDLFASVEYGRPDNYRKNVLRPLHDRRLLEFDATKKLVHVTPLGGKHAEAIVVAKRAL